MNRLFKIIPKLSYKLSGKSLLKTGEIFFRLFLFLCLNKLSKKERKQSFEFRFEKQNIQLTLYGLRDLLVLEEIFLEEEYEITTQNKDDIKNIIDAGANIGISSLYFLCKFPKATIYAFEPHPEVFEKLQRNVTGYDRIKPYNLALSNTEGKVDLYLSNDSIGSSLNEREGSNCIQVDSATFSGLLKELNLLEVDIFKFDIEGSEFDLFTSDFDFSKINHITGEVHGDIVGRCASELIDKIPYNDINVSYSKKGKRAIISV